MDITPLDLVEAYQRDRRAYLVARDVFRDAADAIETSNAAMVRFMRENKLTEVRDLSTIYRLEWTPDGWEVVTRTIPSITDPGLKVPAGPPYNPRAEYGPDAYDPVMADAMAEAEATDARRNGKAPLIVVDAGGFPRD